MNNKTKSVKEGWKKKGVYDEPRLSELVDMYKEIGFEVLVLDYEANTDNSQCNECIKKNPEKYKILYTRK
jgi:hypothetical protein